MGSLRVKQRGQKDTFFTSAGMGAELICKKFCR